MWLASRLFQRIQRQLWLFQLSTTDKMESKTWCSFLWNNISRINLFKFRGQVKTRLQTLSNTFNIMSKSTIRWDSQFLFFLKMPSLKLITSRVQTFVAPYIALQIQLRSTIVRVSMMKLWSAVLLQPSTQSSTMHNHWMSASERKWGQKNFWTRSFTRIKSLETL